MPKMEPFHLIIVGKGETLADILKAAENKAAFVFGRDVAAGLNYDAHKNRHGDWLVEVSA